MNAPPDAFALAIQHHQAGRLAEAERLYRMVLAADPGHADSLNLLGVVAAQTGRVDLAVERIQKAIAANDKVAAYHNNLGEVLRQAGRFSDAAGHFRRALDLDPAYADAHNNLGAALHGLGGLDEAIGHYRQALGLRPAYPQALSNMGAAWQEKNDLSQAAACYRQALDFPFDDANTRANLATVLLAQGDFAEGFRLYEWRERGAQPMVAPRHADLPRWTGFPLDGRTILLHAEQGLGDTLQFLRFVTPIARQGARVVLEVPPPLKRLAATVPGLARIVATGEALPPVDCHLPLMSAPHLLGTRLDTIPAGIAYLRPDAAESAAWARRLAPLPGLKVGLVWAGDPRPHDQRVNAIDARRSMALARLAPLLSVPGVTFVSLQKGTAVGQIADLPAELRPRDRMSEIGDLADTAALISALDLVISVDTAVAHLAGALGKPVWIASRFDGCWRWLEDRDDSPWYPTARLFRQKAPGDWDEVVARMAVALADPVAPASVPAAAAEGRPHRVTHGERREGHPAPHLARARHFRQAGRLDDAARTLRAAIEIHQHDADLHFELGLVLQTQGRPIDAERAYRAALALRPDDPLTLNNLGNALGDQGRRDEAMAALRAALARKPNYAEAHFNLGVLEHKVGHLNEAAAAYGAALAAKPDFTAALTNLGAALQESGRLDDAEAIHRRAVRNQPDDAQVHLNLGVTLQQAGRSDEALAAFRQAVRYAPANARAHVNLAHALLMTGQLAEGWRENEWRWKGGVDGLLPRPFAQPQWDGSDLAGRTILLHAEQGLGDALQFARYAEPVAARGGRVILEVHPPLAGLLTTVPGATQVVAAGWDLPPFDVHLPLMSAPFALKTATIPATIPYVAPDSSAAECWCKRLARLDGLKVGLVWGGNPRSHDYRLQAADGRRSIPLASLVPLLALPGLCFVSLQKGGPAAQIARLAPEVRPLDWMDEVADFADTAALVANLDLVISVDTSVAHLVGAMGKPVWILSRFDGCWRWLEDRDDSPWYPTARLFRQKRPGDWAAVVEQVRAALVSVVQNGA